MKTLPTFIFDLDGVITNTEDYHFDAWKSICMKLNYDLSLEKNEELKGVSRSCSFFNIAIDHLLHPCSSLPQ
mgnify:CR=1 FL=1